MPHTAEADTLHRLVADLEHRLVTETKCRAAIETRLSATRMNLAAEREARLALEHETRLLHDELNAVESTLRPDTQEESHQPQRLDGLAVLYVGGRPAQVAHLRKLGEERGAVVLHHDGGIENHASLLPDLTRRADVVLFPVDCVSHDAAWTVKRVCRQAGKRFIPLRSASATTFLAALRGLNPLNG